MAHQIFEQSEFAWLELDFFFRPMHFAFEQVHREIADDETSRFRRLSCTANESLDAGEQFRESKGFGEVIVAAGLKAADAVIDSCLGAKDEDRSADIFVAEFPDDAEAIEFGKHDVHDGRVVGNRLSASQAIFAIRAMVDREATL